ncbi:pyridoxamine 5'-phosphate oxidase family protein [Geomonas sp. Red32]|uniref:pyridoxamine 5'-phosphate oxidase family protein n=1 Tax=Geomonas sp. Red32 TaxID=2912856 RepID=UPI00202CB97B|nr:pyridoxamine 5'-phosphate oxidase family protein [Geomonas sp. Red32]MCM0084313.1 pyridoxamine 5'-phosphate oxidase family protein [Geomonas sp. Red32]
MRPIRRSERQIATEDALSVLEGAEYGILSTVGEDNQPYGIPLSFAVMDEAIYFHCALEGHKLDNITHNDKVSFCVVGKTKVLPNKFATEYESTVVFGTASKVEGAERHNALLALLEKYSADFMEEGKKYIAAKGSKTDVIKITITHVTGKARR